MMECRAETLIRQIFEPVFGSYAWAVSKGFAGYLTIEFGNPHLKVRDPIAARHATSPLARELLARRRVYPVGDWSLFVENYHWLVCQSGECVGAEDESVEKALERLDGQKLVDARFDDFLELSFDLGTSLRLKSGPVDERGAAQWTLFRFQGQSVTLENDGTLSVESASG